jgi:uncharacterized SAM-binding protein YcdF (DUF218 family)
VIRPGAVALAALWLGAAAALFLVPHGDDAPRRADAIVVLAGNEERLPAALALQRDGVAPVVAISYSDELEDEQRAEACAGPEPIRPSLFCFRAEPFSTRGEARAAARLARERGWDELVIVTSGYHVFRARTLFERCLEAELAVVGSDAVWWEDAIALFTESVKLVIAETLRRGC